MVTAGAGLYSGMKSKDLAEKNLQTVQNSVDARRNMYMSAGLGDLYNKLVAGTNKQIDMAGSMDPQVLAAAELEKRRALLDPYRKRDEAKLMAMLQSKGMLGAATYGQPGAEGAAATNPMMGGLKAAQAEQDTKMAADAMNYGESYLDRLLKRGQGMFSTASQVDNTLNNRQDQNQIIAATMARDKANTAGTQGAMTALPGLFNTVWKGIGGVQGVKDIGSSISGLFGPSSGYMSNMDLGGYADMAPSPSMYDDWSNGEF
jgi:hypothetical protein